MLFWAFFLGMDNIFILQKISPERDPLHLFCTFAVILGKFYAPTSSNFFLCNITPLDKKSWTLVGFFSQNEDLRVQWEVQRNYHPVCDISMEEAGGDGFNWRVSIVPTKRLETRWEKKTKRVQEGWMVQKFRWSNQRLCRLLSGITWQQISKKVEKRVGRDQRVQWWTHQRIRGRTVRNPDLCNSFWQPTGRVRQMWKERLQPLWKWNNKTPLMQKGDKRWHGIFLQLPD